MPPEPEVNTPMSDDAIVIAYVKRGRDYPSFMCDAGSAADAQAAVAAMNRNPDVVEVIGVFTLGFVRGRSVKTVATLGPNWPFAEYRDDKSHVPPGERHGNSAPIRSAG